MPPLAALISTVLEIAGIPILTAGLWSGFAGAWMWLKGRDGEIERAAKAAAPPGFIVGLYLAIAYVIWIAFG